MRRLLLFICFIIFNFSFAQKEAIVKKDTIAKTKAVVKNDTIIKTEVIDVVTAYAPKITDAFKIKKNPTIILAEGSEKKKLDYKILSIPVASTFQPKKVEVKKLKIPEKERIFPNYVAFGLGNSGRQPLYSDFGSGTFAGISPYAEAYIHQRDRFGTEFGIYGHFDYTPNPVEETPLSSTSFDFSFNAHYKKESQYFNWTIGLDFERKKRNWYGLPKNNFTDEVLEAIDENQTLGLFNIYGKANFYESYLKNSQVAISFFSDKASSGELNLNITTELKTPAFDFLNKIDGIEVGVLINYLEGRFDKSYQDYQNTSYGSVTLGVNPTFTILLGKFNTKVGFKGLYNFNTDTSASDFLLYPDVELSYPIFKHNNHAYVGLNGDLQINSYRSLTDKNPFLAPTQNIVATNNRINFFAGLRGSLTKQVYYNFKGSFTNQQNLPMFMLNNSKSNGSNTAYKYTFKGYEYGNSFKVIYDGSNTTSFLAEATYEHSRELSIKGKLNYDVYSLKNEDNAWNLPSLKAEFSGNYRKEKWNAGAAIFYVGGRKGIEYKGVYDNTIGGTASDYTIKDIDGYIDVNINGTYELNPTLSVFLKGKNLLNSSYQRFNNFDSHGLQLIGGLIWEFDSLF